LNAPPVYRAVGYGKERVITAADLATFCLHSCGGGYTESQTAKAMLMQSNAVATGKLTRNITITEIK
jgi:hypothetical protein